MKSRIDVPTSDVLVHFGQERGKPIEIYNFAGIIGKSFSKAFTKHNTEKVFNVTGIYPLNETGEDEFLSSFVSDRSYQSGKRTTNCIFRFQEQRK